jgi:hypothetical protein
MSIVIVTAEKYAEVKDKLLRSEESFDKEVYDIIKDHGNPAVIRLPAISVAERHILHTLTHGGIYIYSREEYFPDGSRSMSIDLPRKYVNKLKKKYADLKVQLANDINALVNNFADELMNRLNISSSHI